MVTAVFEVISQGISNFVASLVSAINGLLPLIYTESSGTITFNFVGVMLLIAVAMGIVYWCFRLIRGLTAGLAR